MRLSHPPPIEAEMMMKGVRIVEPTDWASTLLLRSLLPGEYLSKRGGGEEGSFKVIGCGKGRVHV